MPVEGHDTTSPRPEMPASEHLKIPVMEEHLVVGKEWVETGRVLVSKNVVKEQALFNTTVNSEEVSVERKEVNQYVEKAPAPVRQEGDVTIISVVKEVLVVEKRLMLVEELHITKRQRQEQKTFSEVLKKEEVTVTRVKPDGNQ